jgi:hypothetical protein
MQSPFKIFRKHQKVILAGLTLMAMIGFGIGDTLVRMVRVGAANRAIKSEVETSIGNLSQMQMHNLLVQRTNLQKFIGIAFQKSHADLFEKPPYIGRYLMPRIMAEYGFGGTSKEDLLFAWLHRHEARKMGIVVSDPQIKDYIGRITENKLSSTKLQEIVDDMHMSPQELFDSFRDELEAQIAIRMKIPSTIPSPEKYWEYYQQLNTREVIEAAALPVADFADKVPDPTDAQVASLFEKHKNDFEQAYDAKYIPGFRQPHKVKLHYLTIGPSAVEDKLKAMGKVTDKEVEEYYEKNKETVLWMQERSLPPTGDNDPLLPEFAPEKGPALDSEKGDEPEGNDENKDSGDAEPPADESGAKGEKSRDEGQGNSPEDKSSCAPASASGDDDEPQKPDAKPSAADGGDAKPKQPKKTATAAAKDDGDEKPGAEESSDGKESDGDEKPAGKEPQVTPKKPEPPKIKFKPLNDELRERIRDTIVNERRQKLLKELTAKAVKALQDVGLSLATSAEIKLTDPDPEQLERIQRRSEDELRKIASTLDVKFNKTELVSPSELSEVPGLGKAFEPFTSESMQVEPTTILEQAFGREGRAGESLCRIYQSEGSDSTTYVWWKVEDVPAHVPKLDDAGVRRQVVKAWKRLESIPLATKRGDELAEKARGDEDLTKALAGQTVTGDPKSLAITVSGPSPEFSFYQDSSAPDPMRGGRSADVRFGNPIIVTGAYRKFMQAVFNRLGVGEVGAVLNDDASVCYVVRVISRRDADRDAFKDAPLFDRSTPYERLAQSDLEEVVREYSRRLRDKYAIKWNEQAARETGSMLDDE